jgi:hypothetical protein
MPDAARDWAAGQLNAEHSGDKGDAIPIVDETPGVKSPTDCAGTARQYCGTTGSVALCQVASTLTYTVPAGYALIGDQGHQGLPWAMTEITPDDTPRTQRRSCLPAPAQAPLYRHHQLLPVL